MRIPVHLDLLCCFFFLHFTLYVCLCTVVIVTLCVCGCRWLSEIVCAWVYYEHTCICVCVDARAPPCVYVRTCVYGQACMHLCGSVFTFLNLDVCPVRPFTKGCEFHADHLGSIQEGFVKKGRPGNNSWSCKSSFNIRLGGLKFCCRVLLSVWGSTQRTLNS